MSRFHALTLSDVRRETPDAVSLAFDVPPELAADFAWQPGQYLTLRAMLDGEPLSVTGPYGLAYDPLNDRWSEGDDVGVNYMMMATRDA